MFQFKGTLKTRKDQFRTIRHFIEQKTENASPNDLIVLCGDLNVNGRPVDRSKCKIFAALKDRPEFLEPLDTFYKEYDTFIDIMTGNGRDEVTDVCKTKYGQCPVTFGDAYEDEEGKECPTEEVLTDKMDYCTKQCLDYIFEIKRSFNIKDKDSNPSSTSKTPLRNRSNSGKNY